MFSFDQKFIVIDTETEGLNLRYSNPWEVSYLEACGKKILKRKQIYIDVPNLNLSPFIRKLTGFDEDKYNKLKVPAQEAWAENKKVIYDETFLIIGQNILKFDIFMLNQLCRNATGKEINFSFLDRILDTRYLALAAKNDIAKPRDGNFLNWSYKIGSDPKIKGKVSQLVLLKDFGIKFDPEKLHDGLYDCEKLWEIFCELKSCLKL